jgi:peptide-methionine (S)-S-oxide reductase
MKRVALISTLALCGVLTMTAVGQAKPNKKKMETKDLIVGSGCFWCTEAIFEDLQGVVNVESGYAGGQIFPVTYEQVCSGRTGHAEVIRITFNPKEVSEADLLRLFFVTHDPTTLNRQGPDSGTQYRSAIFYKSDEDKALASKILKEVSDAKIYSGKIVTTLEPLTNYQAAEEYHQNYFEKYEKASPAKRATMNAGYCNAIVAPKVAKFRQKYAAKLKKKG